MLKALVPHLIASGLAALIGAGIGGGITYFVVTEDTRTKLVAGSYDTYLTEAARALIKAQLDTLAKKDRERLYRATAVLILTASEEVLCRAFEFELEIRGANPKATDEFTGLWSAMRAEIMGEDNGVAASSGECTGHFLLIPGNFPKQGENHETHDQ